MSLLPALPETADLVTPELAVDLERHIAATVEQLDDIDTAEEWRAQADALAAYLRHTDSHGPMLGAMRRIEARIGQLLGEPIVGSHRSVTTEGAKVGRQERVEFRALARGVATGSLSYVGEDSAWRASRRALLLNLGHARAHRPTVEPTPPPEGTYDLIYADPPWRYEAPGGATPELRAVERHYPTMTVEDIAALPVPAAEDAVCFLWATNPLLREGLEVLDGWGFTYRTNLVWVKDRIGMGYWVRGQHELLLIGRRGGIATPAENLRPPSVLHAPRLAHSAKPEVVYELLESMYPNATRIEMFARTQRLGWDSWGAEAA